MNTTGHMCRCLLVDKLKFLGKFKNFHIACSLRQQELPKNYQENKSIESSLWLTNLPSKSKSSSKWIERKKLKVKSGPLPTGPAVISCKRKEFNHYKGMTYGKFDVIPLASKGWKHRYSKGDYFTILPVSDHPAFLVSPSERVPLTFSEMGVVSEIQEQLKQKMDISFPTTIQAKTISGILEGENMLMTAETGSGKTLAYLIPIAQNILYWKKYNTAKTNAPFAMVLLPTRELALQVGIVATNLCSDLGIKCLTLMGGKTKQLLLNPVVDFVDILVCTFGVIRKMITHKCYTMDLCKHVVVDEADTLLDDSFNVELKYFLRKLKLGFGNPHLSSTSKTAQFCLVSATMPTNLETILEGVIPVDHLKEVSTDYLHKIQPHIPQHFMRLGSSQKPEELLKIVQANVKQRCPTMIFSNKTNTTNWMNYFLNQNGISSVRLNGTMPHEERLQQYQEFRKGNVDVIATTDITSRGLDCTRVKHVINYDFPRFMADYIHRCGRTGRIGHVEGCRITNFICSQVELPLVWEIEKAVRTQRKLKNVNNNIARIIEHRRLRRADQT